MSNIGVDKKCIRSEWSDNRSSPMRHQHVMVTLKISMRQENHVYILYRYKTSLGSLEYYNYYRINLQSNLYIIN